MPAGRVKELLAKQRVYQEDLERERALNEHYVPDEVMDEVTASTDAAEHDRNAAWHRLKLGV